MNIDRIDAPPEHKKLLTTVKRFLMDQAFRSEPNKHIRELMAYNETCRIYKEYGYKAMRYAAKNARGYQSFINHCDFKKKN